MTNNSSETKQVEIIIKQLQEENKGLKKILNATIVRLQMYDQSAADTFYSRLYKNSISSKE